MFKKAFLLVTSFVAVFVGIFLAQASQVRADSGNLISNPSAEDNGSNGPIGWNQGSWGDNTASFTTDHTSQDGLQDLKLTLTSYTSGDAKWYFDPVAVTGGKYYVYSDYYFASSESVIVGRSEDTSGNYTYFDIGTLAANNSYSQASFTFSVPADAVKLTVFHLIATNGTLQTDNFSLTQKDVTIDPSNLIANPSFELGNDSPINWIADNWGENMPTFEYTLDGQDGSRSAKITVTGYISGDAKWTHDAVSANPNHVYAFSDYSKSDTETQVVLQSQNANGDYSYFWIGTVEPSDTWQANTFTFDTPNDSSKITVFHLIQSNGYLETDNYKLTDNGPITATITDRVPNNSLEQINTSTGNPLAWQTDSWGTNTHAFTYLTDGGQNGASAIRTEITAYTSGDAKWDYAPQAVTPGENLSFSDYYQSNITSRIVIMFNNNDNSQSFIELKSASASSAWTKYLDSFVVPANAKSMTVFHLISAVGYLVTDNYHVTNYVPVGFNAPLISITLDDGWESEYTIGEPIFKQYNMPATFYIITDYLGTEGYMTNDEVSALIADGQQIGSHTVDHPHLPTLSDADLNAELADSIAYLQQTFNVPAIDFAAPYGEVNDHVISAIQQYYRSERGVIEGYNYKDSLDLYHLKVQDVLVTTTQTEVQSWIDEAKRTNAWLILVFHELEEEPGDIYGSHPADFAADIKLVNDSGVRVLSIDQAITNIQSQ